MLPSTLSSSKSLAVDEIVEMNRRCLLEVMNEEVMALPVAQARRGTGKLAAASLIVVKLQRREALLLTEDTTRPDLESNRFAQS